MKVAVFGTKRYDREYLERFNAETGTRHELIFREERLSEATVASASGCAAVCVFVNDDVSANVLESLAALGIKGVALRCAGFNNVDLKTAQRLGITVARVPAYSPHAVAEHAVALILTLNRKTHRAFNRVREGNFELQGLLGFDLHGKTIGTIGTGQIGLIFGRILHHGFGCRWLASDPKPSDLARASGAEFVELDHLYAESDIISLHCPLTPQTHHLINTDSIAKMKRGVMLINTSRGAVVNTRAVIQGLKSGIIGALGLDVYEEEADVFFENLSDQVLQDDVLARLLSFPNVLVTSHQAYFTHEAMEAIARVTLANLTAFETGTPSGNELV